MTRPQGVSAKSCDLNCPCSVPCGPITLPPHKVRGVFVPAPPRQARPGGRWARLRVRCGLSLEQVAAALETTADNIELGELFDHFNADETKTLSVWYAERLNTDPGLIVAWIGE